MTESDMSSDRKVLVCLHHGAEEPESVLTAYLIGVESLRAGKQSVMFLTGEAVRVATCGFAATIEVPGAPSVAKLHEQYVTGGGRFFACPISVRTRNMQDAEWVPNAEVAGMPSVFEYTTGGTLVFNY